MSLTEGQLKLIEENRRKAIAKRQARTSQSNQTNSNQNSNQNSAIPPSVTKNNTSFTPGKFFSTPTSKTPPSSFKRNTPDLSTKFSKTLGASSSKSPCNASRTPVTFQLISRQQFLVEAPFNSQMIEIFKTIPSRTYDAAKRKWVFALNDHKLLLERMDPLLSSCEIHPLPNFVLQIFRTASAERNIPEVDISNIDPKLFGALMPFQHQSVYFGVSLNGRVLIADDMGLGKTLQALALAHYYLQDWPLLIVTPSSMKYSWNEAIQVWLPSVPLHHIQVLATGRDYIDKEIAVTICSYDLLSRKSKELSEIKYKVIIFDESHLLKSNRSQRAKGATSVSAHSKRVILLSGTPALSRPEELYSQIQILENKPFAGFHAFGLRYCGGKQTNFGWNYQGATNMTELQLILEEKYMIRRLKTEVLSQLPSKQRQMIVLDPCSIKSNTKSMQSKASCMNDTVGKGIERRGALLSYYSESSKAKSKAVCDYITDLLRAGKKFLCFAHHTSLMQDISDCIYGQSVEYIRIDGRITAEERKKLCDDFQMKDNVRVAVLSITAASTGLTLTAANLVVFAELFWNPGVLTQAEDRAHRIGQQDSVVVQYLVAKGTADDYLWPLVQQKLDVLSKAGLSKDNFHDAGTTHLTNSKQNSIPDFLEALALEEVGDLAEIAEDRGASEPESKRAKPS